MTGPDRTPHPEDPAEGGEAGSGTVPDGRTPHPQDPAEGVDTDPGSAQPPGR